jgi:hypothetical protein
MNGLESLKIGTTLGIDSSTSTSADPPNLLYSVLIDTTTFSPRSSKPMAAVAPPPSIAYDNLLLKV